MKRVDNDEAVVSNNFDKYKQPFIILFTCFLLVATFVLACSIGLFRFRDLPKAAAATVDDNEDYTTSIDSKDIFFQPLGGGVDKPDSSVDFTELTPEENAKIDHERDNLYYTSKTKSILKLQNNFTKLNRAGDEIEYYLTEDVFAKDTYEVLKPLENETFKRIRIILNGYTISGTLNLEVKSGINLIFMDKAPKETGVPYNPNAVRYFAYNPNTRAYSTVTTTQPAGKDVTAMPSFTMDTYIKVEGSAIAPSLKSSAAGLPTEFSVYANGNSRTYLFDINIVGLENRTSIFELYSLTQCSINRTNIIGNAKRKGFVPVNDVFAAINITGQAIMNLTGTRVFGNSGEGEITTSLIPAYGGVIFEYSDILIGEKALLNSYQFRVLHSNVGTAGRYKLKGPHERAELLYGMGLKGVNFNSTDYVQIDFDDFAVTMNRAPNMVGCVELIYQMDVTCNIANSNLSFLLHNYYKNGPITPAGYNSLTIGKDAQLDGGIFTKYKAHEDTQITILGKVNYVNAAGSVTVEDGAWINYFINGFIAEIKDGAKIGCFRQHGKRAKIYQGATVGWAWLTGGVLTIFDKAKIGIVLYHQAGNFLGNKLDYRKYRPSTYYPQVDVYYNLNHAAPPAGTSLLCNHDGNLSKEPDMPSIVPDLKPVTPEDMLPPEIQPDCPDNTPDNIPINPDDILPPNDLPEIDGIIEGATNITEKYLYQYVLQWAMVDDKQMESVLNELYDTYFIHEEAEMIEMLTWSYQVANQSRASNHSIASYGLTQMGNINRLPTANDIRAMARQALVMPVVESWIYGYKENNKKTVSGRSTVHTVATTNMQTARLTTMTTEQLVQIDEALENFKQALLDLLDVFSEYNEIDFIAHDNTAKLMHVALKLEKAMILQDIIDGYTDGRLALTDAKKQAQIVIKDLNERIYLDEDEQWQQDQLTKELAALKLDTIQPATSAVLLNEMQIKRRRIINGLIRNNNITMNLDKYLLSQRCKKDFSYDTYTMTKPIMSRVTDGEVVNGVANWFGGLARALRGGPAPAPDPTGPTGCAAFFGCVGTVGASIIIGVSAAIGISAFSLMIWGIVKAVRDKNQSSGSDSSNTPDSKPDEQPVPPQPVPPQDEIDFNGPFGGYDADDGFTNPEGADNIVPPDVDDVLPTPPQGELDESFGGFEGNLDLGFTNPEGADNIVPPDEQPVPPQPEPPKDEIDFNGPFGGYDTDDSFSFDDGSQGGVNGGNGTLPDGSGTNTPTTPNTAKTAKYSAGTIAVFYSLIGFFLLLVAGLVVFFILRNKKQKRKMQKAFNARMNKH